MKNIIVFILTVILPISVMSQTPNNYENIITHSQSGMGSVKILTKIPMDGDHMPTVKIEGYSVVGGPGATIGLNIAWRTVGGAFENASASSFGGIAPTILISDVEGFIQIFIDTWSDEMAIKVSAIDGGIGEDPGWFTDWAITDDSYDQGNQFINAGLLNRAGYGEFSSLSSQNYSGPYANITNIHASNVNASWGGFSSLTVSNKTTTDQQSGFTNINVINRRTGGGDYRWSLMSGATGGGWGVTPNGFDLFEYPGGGSGNCCIPRMVVHPSEKNGVLSNITPFVINPNGSVLIGYSNASAHLNTPYALSVKGDIKAKKLKITITPSEWPDYVFATTYRLRPLSEVENFIKKNKHLPDVPSADEIGKNGIDVGENQAILLRKIEELTLYIIDLKKEIDLLKKIK